MSGSKETAAEYIEGQDEEMRLRLAEIAEFVAHFSTAWTIARVHVREHPSAASAVLAEAEVDFERCVRNPVIECMGEIRSARERLDAELAGRASGSPEDQHERPSQERRLS